MAQKIKLDLDSTDNLDFESQVDIPAPEGKKALRITFKFKYRSRREIAKLFDNYLERSRSELEAAEQIADGESRKTLAQSADEAIERDVATTMDIASGWNLDLEFNAANLAKFFDRYPGAAIAIATHYRVSLTEGRLGNSGK